MTITVRLHSILLGQIPHGAGGELALALPDGADVASALAALKLTLPAEALILVVNHRILRLQDALHDGDVLEVFPAISGG